MKELYGYPAAFGRFRCIHCGGRFDVSPQEDLLFSEGYYDSEPDECTECQQMILSSTGCYDTFSDADPGL